MKLFLAIFVSAAVAFAAAWYFVSAQKTAELQAERAIHELALKAERDRVSGEPSTRAISSPEAIGAASNTSRHASSAEIMERLKTMRVAGGTQRNQSLRLVIHLLETLVEQGNESVQPIRTFLALNQDVNYTLGNSSDLSNYIARYGKESTTIRVSTDFLAPPSLRLGLISTLKEIGGQEAQKVMAEVLSTSGRAVEVATIARMLEEMAPGVYRELSANAAKDLLANPVASQNPDQMDQNAKSYLYSVLAMYNDTSFADTARRLLVTNGVLDRNALDYLASTVKEAGVSALLDAYNNPALTNRTDKALLASSMLGFVGQNAQANQMFNDLVTNPNIDPRQRALTILRLAGFNGGGTTAEAPKDQSQVAAITSILQNLRLLTTTDATVAQAIDVTVKGLASGKPLDASAVNFLRTAVPPGLATPPVGSTATREAIPFRQTGDQAPQPIQKSPRGAIQVVSPGQ